MTDSIQVLVISIIRTVIAPTVAGWALSLVVLMGVDSPSVELRSAVTAVLAMAWYLTAKLLETRNPLWGAMLLYAVQPDYGAETEHQILTAVQRTAVPLLVGWVVTQAALLGLELETSVAVLALQGVITSAYYGVLRYIEQSKPKAGVLLGKVAEPVY